MANVNPLFYRNIPDNDGNYVCQGCYGYKTFEAFVKAAKMINDGIKKPNDFDKTLPTANSTRLVTGILEAGRISLDNDGKQVKFLYDSNDELIGLKLES